MKAVIIYDDTGRKSEVITDIIGEVPFHKNVWVAVAYINIQFIV